MYGGEGGGSGFQTLEMTSGVAGQKPTLCKFLRFFACYMGDRYSWGVLLGVERCPLAEEERKSYVGQEYNC